MAEDFRVWLVESTPIFPDPRRLAFQLRRSLIDWSQGRWSAAADWTPVWITFGPSWLDGDEPIPWPAHAALWDKLGQYGSAVLFNRGLSGIPRLPVPREAH